MKNNRHTLCPFIKWKLLGFIVLFDSVLDVRVMLNL